MFGPSAFKGLGGPLAGAQVDSGTVVGIADLGADMEAAIDQTRPSGPLQLAVILRSRTTALHFASSFLMKAVNSARVVGCGVRPCLFSASFMLGSLSTFTISTFQRSSIGAGVLPGATKAYQFSASKP